MPLVLRQPRTAQPQGPAQIDPSLGLVPLTVYNGGSGPIDLVRRTPLTRGIATTFGPTIGGIGSKQTAVNTGISQSGRVYPSDSVGYTAIWSGTLLGAFSGSTPKLIGIAASNVGQSVDIIGLEFNSTTDFVINFKSATTNSSRSFANSVPAAGPCTLVAVYDIAQGFCRLHVFSNGKITSYTSTSIAGPSAPTITGAEVFCLGPDVIEDPSRFSNVNVTLGGVFSGVLGAAKEVGLASNPWQIFAPQSRQIWVPAAASGNFFTSLVEATTAADAASNVASLSGTSNESVTASDATNGVGAGAYAGAANEPATAADTHNRVYGASGAISEPGSAADALSQTLSATSTITEPATATDAASQLAALSGVLTENATANDTTSGSAAGAYSGSASEPGAAADFASQVAALSGTASEPASAADIVGNVLAVTVLVAEAAAANDTTAGAGAGAFFGSTPEPTTATDTVSNALAAAASITEAATAADTAAASAALTVNVAETVSASDLAVAVKAVQALIAEAVAAADSANASAAGAYLATVFEAGGAVDSQVSAASMFATVVEAASANDYADIFRAWALSVAEAASAADFQNGGLNVALFHAYLITVASERRTFTVVNESRTTTFGA